MRSISILPSLALLLFSSAPTGASFHERPFIFEAVDDEVAVFEWTDHGLWRTDGTAAGTFQLLPECGADCDDVVHLGKAAGKLFFLREDLRFSQPRLPLYQVWATDGSVTGTVQLTDAPNGLTGLAVAASSYVPAPELGLLFFTNFTEESGAELWASDGTPEGTRLVADLVTGSESSVARPLAALGGQVLFRGREQALDNELWVTDGTAAGTRLLKDLLPGEDGSEPVMLAVANDLAFFTLGGRNIFDNPLRRQLWVTDGTTSGTKLIFELPPLPDDPVRWLDAIPTKDGVFLEARDGLFFSDGTVAGTRQIVPISAFGVDLPVIIFSAVLGGRLLFSAEDLEHGREPWVSDGTPEGTHLLADICPGACSSVGGLFPAETVATEEALYFPADDGSTGLEPWVTDGTTAGTRRLSDFCPGTCDGDPHFDLGPDDSVFFQVLTPQGQTLWTIGDDGSPILLLDPEPLRPFGDVLAGAPLGDLFLFGTSAEEAILWSSDGTPTGTVPYATLEMTDPGTPPAPITSISARTTSATEITLTWSGSARADVYRVEIASPDTEGFVFWSLLPAGDTVLEFHYALEDLVPGLPYTVRVRAENSAGFTPWVEASATPLDATTDPCAPGPETLCLRDDRFTVTVHWRDQINGGSGQAEALPFDFSDDSGAFTFFDEANVELVVKVLNGETVNGFQWVFFGALSTVEYWVTVLDNLEAESRTYHNPPGELCGQADVAAFPREQQPGLARAASDAAWASLTAAALPTTLSTRADSTAPPAATETGTPGTCAPGPDTLCLTPDRYRIEVSWRDPASGDTGVGHAIPGTTDSGYFWFFNPDNVELVVKVLDARVVNGHVWVFFGALTHVDYDLVVTDTVTGQPRTYHNPPGTICGQADVAAF